MYSRNQCCKHSISWCEHHENIHAWRVFHASICLLFILLLYRLYSLYFPYFICPFHTLCLVFFITRFFTKLYFFILLSSQDRTCWLILSLFFSILVHTYLSLSLSRTIDKLSLMIGYFFLKGNIYFVIDPPDIKY